MPLRPEHNLAARDTGTWFFAVPSHAQASKNMF
jgi:hypothetical protein